MQKLGISPAHLRGWGRKGRQLQDYICLSFHLPPGILRSEKAPPAILLVDPGVVAWLETCFCPANSASSRIRTEEILVRLDLPSFESLFQGEHGHQLRYRQSEVLVQGHIPLEYIHAIVLPESRQGAQCLKTCRKMRRRRRLRGHWRFPRILSGSWQKFA
jgi:hypothetical protein